MTKSVYARADIIRTETSESNYTELSSQEYFIL